MQNFKEFLNELTKKINYKDGVYISVFTDDETNKKIQEYQKKYLNGFELNNELHCTLIYSQKEFKNEITTKDYKTNAKFKSFELFGKENDTLVIKLDSEDLVNRNKELVKKYGFVSNFDEYHPHVTIANNCKDVNLDDLPQIDFNFVLSNETVEPLNDEYSN